MDKRPLFRPEVLAKKINTEFGVVSINLPPSYKNIACVLSLVIVAIISLMCTAQIVETYSVPGYLNADKGIVAIYPNKNGTLTEAKIKQGDVVKKGDILFVVDTRYQSLKKDQDKEIIQNLNHRKLEIEQQLSTKLNHLEAIKTLLNKKYISVSDYNKSREQYFELRNRKHDIELEIIHYKREKSYTVRSPVDGTVTSVLQNEGQALTSDKPLAHIVPKNSELIAELFVPSAKSGFVSKGQLALIQYDAFPHARYGSYSATIVEVGETILTDDQQKKPITISMPYYHVKAKLKQPYVMLYGHEKKCQQGMTLTARIVGPKRKIWQWVLDPIYSFYGSRTV
jgi:membrane fusion protein